MGPQKDRDLVTGLHSAPSHPTTTLPGDKLEDLEETEASGTYSHDPAPAQMNMEPHAEGCRSQFPSPKSPCLAVNKVTR